MKSSAFLKDGQVVNRAFACFFDSQCFEWWLQSCLKLRVKISTAFAVRIKWIRPSRMAAIGHATAEERKAAILLLEPDFHGLLERKGVTEELQARLSTLVVRSISRFNAIADDRGQLRTFAVRSLERDAGVHAVEIAAILDAWEAARTRMEVRHKAEAEAASANLPMAVNKVEIHDLKRRFEAMHYKLDEKSMPASGTLEQIFDQLENGELKVMHLVQFLSRDDAEVDPVGATIDKAGNIKVRKGYGETTEPRGAEEYRQRMRVVAHTYLMAQLKYPHRQSLNGLEPHHFQRYVDYVLGEQIMGLKAKDDQGNVVSSPAFSLILHYEHQVRKEMVRLFNEGRDLHEALDAARKDGVIKERFFLTPAAMSALTATQKRDQWSGRSRSPNKDGAYGYYKYNDKGKGKYKGGGKGKKGKKSGPDGATIHSRTPDGREICYKWNSQHDRCRHACGRLHVCQICFGNHPMHSCKGNGPPSKDTAGGAKKAEE